MNIQFITSVLQANRHDEDTCRMFITRYFPECTDRIAGMSLDDIIERLSWVLRTEVKCVSCADREGVLDHPRWEGKQLCMECCAEMSSTTFPDDVCSLCLENLDFMTIQSIGRGCSHVAHSLCLSKAPAHLTRCPLCRAPRQEVPPLIRRAPLVRVHVLPAHVDVSFLGRLPTFDHQNTVPLSQVRYRLVSETPDLPDVDFFIGYRLRLRGGIDRLRRVIWNNFISFISTFTTTIRYTSRHEGVDVFEYIVHYSNRGRRRPILLVLHALFGVQGDTLLPLNALSPAQFSTTMRRVSDVRAQIRILASYLNIQ